MVFGQSWIGASVGTKVKDLVALNGSAPPRAHRERQRATRPRDAVSPWACDG